MNLQIFDELQTSIAQFVAPVTSLKVTDKISCDNASTTYRELKKWEKKLEEKRKELVGPLNAQVDRINEFAKQIKAPLINAGAYLNKELVAFEKILEFERVEKLKVELESRMKREEEVQALIKKQQEEAAAKIKEIENDAAIAAMFETASSESDAIEIAKKEAELVRSQANAETSRIAFEAAKTSIDNSKEIKSNKVSGASRPWVFEIENDLNVPREYLMVDEKKIRESIRSGVREISGIKIFQDYRISAR